LTFTSLSYAGHDATFRYLQIELGTLQAGYPNNRLLSEIPENKAFRTEVWYPLKLGTFQKHERVDIVKLSHDKWKIQNPETRKKVEFSVSYPGGKLRITKIQPFIPKDTKYFEAPYKKTADTNPRIVKHITDIIISENFEVLIFTIKGDQSLTYKAKKQTSPVGLMLSFPYTTLDIPKRAYNPTKNQIISSIVADEIVEDKTTTSRIFIALKRDTQYNLNPDEAELQIIFQRATAFSKDDKLQKE